MAKIRGFFAALAAILAFASPAAAQYLGGAQLPVLMGKQDPFPGASVGLNFTTGQFKAGGVIAGSPSSLPGWSVTRSTGGYAEDTSGNLIWFQPGQARWTNKGLLVEEARTNLLPWSQAFDNGGWVKRNGHAVTADQATAPDGTLTADLITATAPGAGGQGLWTEGAGANGVYSCSLYLKGGTASTVTLLVKDAQTDVIRGTATATLTGSWQRVTASGTTAGATPGVRCEFGANAAGTFFAWGGQAEAATFADSYFPTTAAAATRAADAIGFSGNLFPANSPTTIIGEWTWAQLPGGNTAIIGASTKPTLALGNTYAKASFPGVADVAIYTMTPNVGAPNIAAATFAPASFSAIANGIPVAATGSGATTWTDTTSVVLGSEAKLLNGYIRRVIIYPQALSAAQIQTITSGADTSSLNLNFAAGSYKTTTPYVRTNLLPTSQDFSAWAKAAVTTTANATTAPDGTLTGTKLVATAVTASHNISRTPATYTGAVAWSVYVKPAEYRFFSLFNAAQTLDADCDLVTVTCVASGTGATASITSVANGWYRIALMASTGFTGDAYFAACPTGVGRSSCTGDGTSGVYVWGAQFEAGTFPTSYIATSGVAASVATTSSTSLADIGALTITNSGGYVQWANGTLTAVPANTPRISDLGLLVEQAATNLQTYSQDTSQWTVNNVTKTAGQLAPDGTATATVVNNTPTLLSFMNSPAVTLANSATYTESLYFKPITGTGVIAFEYNTGASTLSATCNGLTGVGTGGATVVMLGSSGWSRCVLTFTTAATGTPVASVTYIGAYGSTTFATSLLIWQKQIELSGFVTSPITTTSASVTRTADVVYLTGAWSGSATLGAEVDFGTHGVAGAANEYYANLSDGTINNRQSLFRNLTTGDLAARVVVGATPTNPGNVTGVAGIGVHRAALSFAAGAAKMAGDGTLSTASAPVSIASTTFLALGVGEDRVSSQLNGYLRRVVIYPYAANDNELQYRSAGNW